MTTLALDIEVYKDYFLIVFGGGGKFRHYEMYEGHPLTARPIRGLMESNRTISFNGIRYDLPILTLALEGASCDELYRASQKIIVDDVPWWKIAKPPKRWDHVDIKEVAPGVAVSLKLYGGRMNSKWLQDLPIHPDESIAPDQRELMIEYCQNDVTTTLELHGILTPQLELRERMSLQYSQNLMSKSDAQIAEAVLVAEVGGDVTRPKIPKEPSRYRAPMWMGFHTVALQELFNDVLGAEFTVDKNGKLKMPPTLHNRKVEIGGTTYKLGVGGLHSQEKKVAHISTPDARVIDVDVASYYPSIILEQGLYPEQCGKKFLEVYRSIVERRLKAKASGDKTTADSLKITINGSFGKLGSSYSKLYAPNLFKQVTVTGQLALLMLIEDLVGHGIPVVSGNTDGVVTRPSDEQLPLLRECVEWWEMLTGYDMEYTEYSGLYSRDVNNYLAVKMDGSSKGKGAMAVGGLMKNPVTPIIAKSVQEFLVSGVPIADTIRSGNVTDYLTVRTVKGGGQWRDGYLGKVVRWYWSTGGEPIRYVTNGNKVATSDGAKPMMTLTDLPDDIDYDKYEAKAAEVLKGLGYV